MCLLCYAITQNYVIRFLAQPLTTNLNMRGVGWCAIYPDESCCPAPDSCTRVNQRPAAAIKTRMLPVKIYLAFSRPTRHLLSTTRKGNRATFQPFIGFIQVIHGIGKKSICKICNERFDNVL